MPYGSRCLPCTGKAAIFVTCPGGSKASGKKRDNGDTDRDQACCPEIPLQHHVQPRTLLAIGSSPETLLMVRRQHVSFLHTNDPSGIDRIYLRYVVCSYETNPQLEYRDASAREVQLNLPVA
jgi:hypothetical protein